MNKQFVNPKWMLKGSSRSYKRDMYIWFALVSAKMAFDVTKQRLNPSRSSTTRRYTSRLGTTTSGAAAGCSCHSVAGRRPASGSAASAREVLVPGGREGLHLHLFLVGDRLKLDQARVCFFRPSLMTERARSRSPSTAK